MNEIDEVKRQLDAMNEAERKEVLRHLRSLLPRHPIEERLMITSDAMLDALGRAGEFTIRMIRGVFAEASFAADVLPRLPHWNSLRIEGEAPYDFLLESANVGLVESSDGRERIRVQVKMQRSEKGRPLHANQVWRTLVTWPADHFVVELQRSRKGTKAGKSTRPYRFGEFDILAVSLGPSTSRWSDFIYTIERWLLYSPDDPSCILTYQPVSPADNDCWTTDFDTAVNWLRSGREFKIRGELPSRTPPDSQESVG